MVVQIGILDDCGGDRFLAKDLGFREAAMPFLCCKVALTDTHQGIQLPTCCFRQRGDRFAQSHRLSQIAFQAFIRCCRKRDGACCSDWTPFETGKHQLERNVCRRGSFDERNFNLVLAQHPALIDGRRLIRMRSPVSGSMHLPEGNSTIFMLIDGEAEVGGLKLNGCHRIGSLKTTEGPYLMDAQACRIEGSARILIGTPQGAAAFIVPNAKGKSLVLLDVGFLSQKAPDTNAAWLLREINR